MRLLIKSHVDQHERHYASGASGTVRAYDDRRQRKPETRTLTKHDLKDGHDLSMYGHIEKTAQKVAARWDVDRKDLDEYTAYSGYKFKPEASTEYRKEAVIYQLLKEHTGSAGGNENSVIMNYAARHAGLNTPEYDKAARIEQWCKDNGKEGITRCLHSLGSTIYDTTQEWLKERGITSVHAHRKGGMAEDKTFSCWALDDSWVRQEAGGEVVEADIPARYIFSTPATGHGNIIETEIVVLGGNRKPETRSNPDAPVHDYQIPPEVAKKMGATTIRLTQGKQIDDHRGFGLEHIRQQHGAEIKAAGYPDEQAFVADVLANFNVIYALDGNRIALVSEHDGRQKIHVVEARKDASGSYYSVVTGYIADRMKFDPKRNRVLWRKLVKAFAALLLRRKGP